MTPKAIIFDFDGVIADSEIASAKSFSRALSEAGLETSIAQATEIYCGLHREQVLAEIDRRWGKLVPTDIAARIAAQADAIFEEGIDPIPGAADFLASVSHLPLAIGSSSWTDYLRKNLERFGLAHHFGPHVYSGREHVARSKPHPDIYLHAAAQLGADPRDCLIVEDSPIGATAAVASGAQVVGFCAGGHCLPDHPERLRAVGVHHIAADYGDLGRLLGFG